MKPVLFAYPFQGVLCTDPPSPSTGGYGASHSAGSFA